MLSWGTCSLYNESLSFRGQNKISFLWSRIHSWWNSVSQKNVADSFQLNQESKCWSGETKKREKKNEFAVKLKYHVFVLLADVSVILICHSLILCACVYECVCIIFPSKPAKHCKTIFKYFRRTAPSICIPLSHSVKRHLSRNIADKRETINPRKITGTESLSCILLEMRQRSHYAHPSGLASDSKLYRSVDMVLFKGTLQISEFWSIILLDYCFLEHLASSLGSAAFVLTPSTVAL